MQRELGLVSIFGPAARCGLEFPTVEHFSQEAARAIDVRGPERQSPCCGWLMYVGLHKYPNGICFLPGTQVHRRRRVEGRLSLHPAAQFEILRIGERSGLCSAALQSAWSQAPSKKKGGLSSVVGHTLCMQAVPASTPRSAIFNPFERTAHKGTEVFRAHHPFFGHEHCPATGGLTSLMG